MILNEKEEAEKKKLDEEIKRIEQENQGKLIPIEPQEIKSYLENIQKQSTFNKDLLENLISFWEKTQKLYLTNSHFVFRKIREQRETATVYLSE